MENSYLVVGHTYHGETCREYLSDYGEAVRCANRLRSAVVFHGSGPDLEGIEERPVVYKKFTPSVEVASRSL